MNNRSVPKIRFTDFHDKWRKYRLQDLKDVRDGTHDSPKYSSDGYPLVTSKNLTDSGLDMTEVSLISRNDFDSINKRSKVDIGDIIFGMIGTIGKPVIAHRADFAIKNVALIKTNGSVSNEFLLQLLKSSVFLKYIRNENVGNTQKFIGLNTIRNFNFYSPNKNEQEKIGSFLKLLDEAIALFQQELTTLKQTKQGFLQKMFPKEGETVPEVRFPGFSGEWEMCNFGDILKINSGRDYKHLEPGEIPVYGTGGYMLSVNESLSDENAIGIGRKGTINKPQLLTAPFWTVDTLFYMTVKNNNVLRFCYTLTNNINWKKHDESTGVPSLSKVNIESIPVRIPKNEEQTQIGNFFKQLDDTIALQEQELETLKQTKQAFLQKMFV